jgi:hypothetical protein
MRSSKVEIPENTADIVDPTPRTRKASALPERSPMALSGAPPARVKGMRNAVMATPFLLYGIYLFCIGIVMYLIGVIAVVPRYLPGLYEILTPISEWLVWYSGLPITLGFALALFDILVLYDRKRPHQHLRTDAIGEGSVTVALTAYNDEESIGDAVRDFRAHPMVRRVIVVSNNSTDRTFDNAATAGALTFNEGAPGYGRCVYRCYVEALRFDDTEIMILCEGDRTFRAHDIDKLLAYAPHADIVNGTRTVEALRERKTQLTTFMFYGNLFVGKLLEAKHLGCSTITDVGTTYKLCRSSVLRELLPSLNPGVNLQFNAHFLDMALAQGLVVLECPITFHARVGESKGGNTGNGRALSVGLAMIRGLTFGWKPTT